MAVNHLTDEKLKDQINKAIASPGTALDFTYLQGRPDKKNDGVILLAGARSTSALVTQGKQKLGISGTNGVVKGKFSYEADTQFLVFQTAGKPKLLKKHLEAIGKRKVKFLTDDGQEFDPEADGDGAVVERQLKLAELAVGEYRKRPNAEPQWVQRLDGLLTFARQALKDKDYDKAQTDAGSIQAALTKLVPPAPPPTPTDPAEADRQLKAASLAIETYANKPSHDAKVLQQARDLLISVEQAVVAKQYDLAVANAGSIHILLGSTPPPKVEAPKPKGDGQAPKDEAGVARQLAAAAKKAVETYKAKPGADLSSIQNLELWLAAAEQAVLEAKYGVVKENVTKILKVTGTSAPPPPKVDAPPKPAATQESARNLLDKATRALAGYTNQPNPEDKWVQKLNDLIRTGEAAFTGTDYAAAEKNAKLVQAAVDSLLKTRQADQQIASKAVDAVAANQKIKEAMTAAAGYVKLVDKDPAVAKELAEALRQAQAARNEGRFDDVNALCERVVTLAGLNLGKPKDDKPLPKEEQAKKELKELEALAERYQEINVATVTEELGWAFTEIMDRHKAEAKNEASAFAGMRGLDDLLTKYPKEEDRKAQVKKMREAVAASRARQQEMGDAIKRVGAPDTDERREALAKARGLQANMLNHIPEAFLQTIDLESRLKNMEAALAQTPRERAEAVAALVKVPDLEAREEADAFKDAIGYGSLKPVELAAFFFDGPVRSITPAQQKKLYEMNKRIIERAHKIRDLGGSVDDAEKALAHIPAEFWPPEFVQELQAWRKVERELAEQRVADLFKKPEKLGDLSKVDILNGAAGIADAVGTLANIVGGISDLDKVVAQQAQIDKLVHAGMSPEAAAKDKSVTDIVGPLGGEGALYMRLVLEESREVTKLMAPIAEYVKSGNIDKLKDLAHSDPKTKENIMTILSKVDSVMSKAKYVSALEGAPGLMSAFPFMAAVGSGMDFMKACYQLKECVESDKSAGRLLEQSDLDFYSGKSNDRALLNAFLNEKDAQSHKKVKKGVEVGGRAISTVGDILKTVPEGHSKLAGYAIKVVGKVIELGHKVVFAGIEWSKAKKAVKTIKAAQAGNPQARLDVFENAAAYAKLYLAICAKEGKPLARQLIVERGMTEADLNKATALQIMGNLMKSAEQRDEAKTNDFGTILSDNVFSDKGTRLLKAAKNSIVAKFKRKPKPEGGWKPPAAQLDPAQFRQVVKDARDNGLDDHPALGTITKALVTADADVKAALALARSGSTDNEAKAKKFYIAIQALEGARDAVMGYAPTMGGGEYEEMVLYLSGLVKAIDRQVDGLHGLYNASGREPWKPTNKAFTPDAWAASWAEAVEACPGLSKSDGGVKKALDAYKKSTDAAEKATKPAKARELRVKARDDLAKVAAALNDCFMDSGAYAEVQEYVDGWLGWTTEESQKSTQTLYDETLPIKPEDLGERAYTEEGWGELFDAATETGLLNNKSGDQGLSKAYAKVDKAKDQLRDAEQLNADGRHAKEVAKARSALIEAQAEVRRATEKLTKANGEAPKQLEEYLTAISEKAKKEVETQRAELDKNKFTAVEGLNARAWQATYKNAVHAGAVPENKKVLASLVKVLTNFTEAQADLKVAVHDKDWKEALLAGQKVVRKSRRVREEIVKAMGTGGYDSPQMKAYMGKLQGLVADATEKDPVLLGALTGAYVPDDKFKAQTFNWTKAAWEKTKKDAVKNGVMAKEFTGFDMTLGKAIDHYAALVKAKPGKKQNAEFLKTKEYLTKLAGIASKIVSTCLNSEIQKFMTRALKMIEIREKNAENLLRKEAVLPDEPQET